MTRFRLAPVAIALLILAGCGKKDDATTVVAPAGTAKAVAAPAGSTWAEQIVETKDGAEFGVRMGNPNAPIKVIEYGSYTCPHCRDFQAEGHEQIEKDVNTGKMSFEYRNLVRDPVDLTVALVAHCAPPAAYFSLNTQFFANQEAMIKSIQAAGDPAYKAAGESPPTERFVKLAELAGLIDFAKARGVPEAAVRACLADPAKAEALVKISESVTTRYPAFPGTPTFIINGAMQENTATWPTLQTKLRAAGL